MIAGDYTAGTTGDAFIFTDAHGFHKIQRGQQFYSWMGDDKYGNIVFNIRTIFGFGASHRAGVIKVTA